MNTPETPALISVIVPVYNVADQIAACIASLRAQTWTGFEAIVVDDGSTDDSVARLRAAIGDDPRFHVIRQANRGLSGARNAALERVRGDFIAFLDGDDRMAPDFLTRMHGALADSDADWVACAIRLVYPDGTSMVHSAIHGSSDIADDPDIADASAPRRFPLTDWSEVIRHFPSVWNKLYRRSLIGDLRFDEGTYYEDHGFFARAAARSRSLLYLPEPLSLHTRNRPGQITGEDSERVFDQFPVLDTVAGVMQRDQSGKSGAKTGFERLAGRLICERAAVLRDPDRRARFAAASTAFLARHDLRYDPDNDPLLSPAWGLEMAGICPLSVIVPWDGQADPLRISLTALAAQNMHGFEILIVPDNAALSATAMEVARAAGVDDIARTVISDGIGAGQARNAGIGAARGVLVVCLDAGDVLLPGALGHWRDTMLRTGADFGTSPFRIGIGKGPVHGGFHDMGLIGGGRGFRTGSGPRRLRLSGPQALGLHAHPSAKIFRRAFLRDSGLRFGTGPLPEWQMVLGAALLAPVSVCFDHPWVEISEAPEARRLWHSRASPQRLGRVIDDIAAALPAAASDRLPSGWAKRLLARALWEKLSFAETRPVGRALFLGAAGAVVRARRLGSVAVRFDPYIDDDLRRLMNQPDDETAIASSGAARDNPAGPGPADRTDNTMLSFLTSGPARFSYRASFRDDTFANISFYHRERRDILFHLSLRAGPEPGEGLAVINQRDAEGWGEEIARPVALPAGAVRVEITFDAPLPGLRVDGAVLFGSDDPMPPDRFPDLTEIGHVDFQGGIAPGSIDMDMREPGDDWTAPLVLDRRLELRGLLGDNAALPRLDIPGTESPPDLITHPGPDGETRFRAVLPGRVWQGVDRDEALEIRLCSTETGAVLTRLTLTRAALSQRIAGVLEGGLLGYDGRAGDAFAVAQVCEHLRFAGSPGQFDDAARAWLDWSAEQYGLESYLPAPDTPCVPDPVPETDVQADEQDPAPDTGTDMALVYAALARITAAADGDPVAVLADLSLEREEGRAVFLALVETFCLNGDMTALSDWATATGLGPFDPGDDDWYNSAILPRLYLRGRTDALHQLMWRLVDATGSWLATPAIAWVLRQAISARPPDEAVRNPLIWAFLRFLDKRAQDYWGRTHCHALIDATVALLAAGDRLPMDIRRDADTVALRVYGLSRRFWSRLGAAGDLVLSPAMTAARDAFAAIAADDGAGNRPALAPALDRLARAGVGDAHRVRRELLGPSGLPLAPGELPDPAAMIDAGIDTEEALLRALAFPGTADAPAALADIAATAMTRFHDTVPHAPYGALQGRIGRQAAALLAPGAPMPAPDDVGAMAAGLATLAMPRAHHVGAGLALGLVSGLIRAGADEAADTALALVQSLIPRDDDAARAALLRAPAVVMALWSLARIAGTDPRAARALAMCDGAVLPESVPEIDPDAAQLAASPLFDTLVTVFSCRPNLGTRIPAMRAGWLGDLKCLGIPYVIVVGEGDGRLEGDILHLDAPDDYEGLPQKTLATIAWVRNRSAFTHMVKIDDDCFLNAEEFFCSLSYRKFDYYGRPLTRHRGQMDRVWHNAKSTSDRGRLEFDKSPEPSTYADGGSGYALSRTAMDAALAAAASPEGRHLIQVSFMEDKLLGDLLALGRIGPENEDYRISIRRRTHPGGHPVSLWVNGFDASRAAPVKLVHMDSHDRQEEAAQTLKTTRITPKKIWPGFQDMALGYQSNALELISPEARLEAVRTAPVVVVATMRNEMFMLPHFLAHYRAIGVENFLIADNCSDDGTLEYLAEQPDVALFSVDTDYNLSQYGVAWQQAMLSAFRVGRWSLIADADELLVWQSPQRQSLPALLETAEFDAADAVRLFMLDLYPRGPLSGLDFASGDPFGETGFVDRTPFLNTWPGRGPYSNSPTWTSALRHRLIAGSRPELFVAQKLALVKYRPWMRFSAGLHYGAGMRLATRELLLGHFKYNADFRRKALAEVARRQHFNDAEEYRRYLAVLAEGREVVFDPAVSIPWTDCAFVGDRLEFF